MFSAVLPPNSHFRRHFIMTYFALGRPLSTSILLSLTSSPILLMLKSFDISALKKALCHLCEKKKSTSEKTIGLYVVLRVFIERFLGNFFKKHSISQTFHSFAFFPIMSYLIWVLNQLNFRLNNTKGAGSKDPRMGEESKTIHETLITSH